MSVHMNEEIISLAKIIADNTKSIEVGTQCEALECSNCRYHSDTLICDYLALAEILYNAGYVKCNDVDSKSQRS